MWEHRERHRKLPLAQVANTRRQEKMFAIFFFWNIEGKGKLKWDANHSFLNPLRANYCHTWHMENHPFLWRRIRRVRRIQVCMARKGLIISNRIAGPGELFSSEFLACAQSPRWATRCSLGSVSCSCDAASRTAVRKRALPVASSLLSEQRRTWLIFAEQIEIFQVKAWLATFKARNANLKLLDDDVEKRKKKQLDRPAEGVHVRLRRSIVDLLSLSRGRSFFKSVVFGVFKFVAS